MLVSLEGEVVRTLQSIKKGIALLDERRARVEGAGDGGDGVAPREELDGVDEEEGASQPARL